MVSLQDLIKKFQLSNDQVNASLGKEQLREASQIVAEDETLGPELGLQSAQEKKRKQKKQKKITQVQRSAMLMKWKQKSAWKKLLLQAPRGTSQMQ